MKICTKCSFEKPLTEFFVKDKRTGQLHAQCKAYYKIQRAITYKQITIAIRQLFHKKRTAQQFKWYKAI